MKRDRLQLAADGIFLSGAPVTSTAAKPGGGRPTIGINLRLWFHFSGSLIPYQFARQRYADRARAPMEKLLSSMEAVIRHLRSTYDARIVLLSMYEPGVESWEDDQSLLDGLKARFAEDDAVTCFRDDVSIADFFHVFKGLDLMIGMRLHSTLISLRCGTPAIHLAYTLKGADIYSDLGLKDWVVPVSDVLSDPASLIRPADAVLADNAVLARTAKASDTATRMNDAAMAAAITKFEGTHACAE
jgi:polysaccharide pyruvyl transferase WcaK-like protein